MDPVLVVMLIGAGIGAVLLIAIVVFAWRHGNPGPMVSEYESARGRWWHGWWG